MNISTIHNVDNVPAIPRTGIGPRNIKRNIEQKCLGFPKSCKIQEIRLQNKTPDVEGSTILIGIIRRRFERIPLEFFNNVFKPSVQMGGGGRGGSPLWLGYRGDAPPTCIYIEGGTPSDPVLTGHALCSSEGPPPHTESAAGTGCLQ